MKRVSFSYTNKKQTTVTIELIGTLRYYVGKAKLQVPITDCLNVIALFRELEEKHEIPRGLLIEDGNSGIKRNLLVLINGREIGVLDGVATLLKSGDRLTLLPVSHGG
jgi:molybdopterin converting factor small subunit